MNIYLLSQTDNDGYDTYSDCVVAAESEELARLISPSGSFGGTFQSWADAPENVIVTLLGVAADGRPAGEILASYHAG
jgi:hypothetical protein